MERTTNLSPAPDLSDLLARHPYHRLPRLPNAYRWGLLHRDRASVKGLRLELIKRLKSFKGAGTPSKMLVFGRPRSGTTLLGSLMAQVPGVHDAGERLHFAAVSPLGLLETSAATCGAEAFVAKLLTYQLLEVQRVRDPIGFFERLLAHGYRLAHLRRRTLPQVLSICTARQSGFYFDKSGARAEAGPIEIALDLDAFAVQFRRSMLMLDYEDRLMSALPHVVLQYEDDLERSERHQPTVDRLCAELAIATGPVRATLKRTGGASGIVRVTNREAAIQAAERLEAEIGREMEALGIGPAR